MKYGNCFFGGCVYNCEKHLKNVIENIHKMGKLFDDYTIIVAYDKSDDKSLDILREEASKFKNFHLLVNNGDKSHIRTQNISNARNAILSKIRELYTEEWEYFSMLDMDDICDLPLNIKTLHQTLQRDDWDSISFNRKIYYDIWALSVEPYLFSCWNWSNSQMIMEKTQVYIEKKLKELSMNELLEVRSAFNGIAFYRCAKFLNCNYDWTTCKKYITGEEFKKNIEATKERPFIRRYNDDCEHRTFHMEAIEKNGARIRISPLSLFID